MKATLHNINGKVMASLTEKPEKRRFGKSTRKGSSGKQYYKALRKWEYALIRVMNPTKDGGYSIDIPGDWWRSLSLNQQAEIEKTDKGCIVTKVL